MDEVRIYRDQVYVMAAPLAGGFSAIAYSDAPFALCINSDERHPSPDPRDAVWGLPREMSVDAAWRDFDHADEYEIVD